MTFRIHFDLFFGGYAKLCGKRIEFQRKTCVYVDDISMDLFTIHLCTVVDFDVGVVLI